MNHVYRSRTSRLYLPIIILLGCLTGPLTHADELGHRVDSIISRTDLGVAKIGLVAVNLTTGSIMLERNATQPMIPASNFKLVTTAAALHTFGPGFELKTTLERVGRDLVIRGEGDPGFGDPTLLAASGLKVEDLINLWVEAAKKAATPDGYDHLLIDDRIFDHTEMVHGRWPDNQLHRWYSAQVAGLNFNTNVLDLYAIPSPKGAAPQILTIPTFPPVQLDNRATSGDRNAFWADRRPNSNLILIRGSIRHALRDPIHVTIHDPPMFFGRLMEQRLRDAGVRIGKVMRVLPEQIVPAGEPLAIVTTDLSAILTRCNRDSQNLYAESMLKWLGHRVTGRPGSWTNGPAAVRMFLSRALGPEAASVVVDDGSGYSRSNRISPMAMSRLLQYIHDQTDMAPRFISSLAKPGEGTLKERFTDPALFDPDSGKRNPRELIGRVYAKSGYLNGVYALSGYVVNEQSTLAFSMMLNQYSGGGSQAKSLMEDVISALDHAVNAPDESTTTPTP